MSDAELQSILARHEAFWRREGEGPLISMQEHAPLEDRGGIPLADGTAAEEGQLITPDMVDPHAFYASPPPDTVIRGDFIAAEGPPALCWTEAAMGCPVRMVTGGAWADPFVAAWDASSTIAPNQDWLAKLDEFMDYLNERAQGGYPLTQPLMRGPVDMMAAAFGHEEACLMLMSEPDAADAALDACADLFIDVAERRLAKTPRFHGGYLSAFGIWTPGTVVRTQVDNATMLSPQTYRERVLPFDRKVIEHFERTIIHLHSGCLHIIDELLEVDALTCMQVSIDFPGGPLAAESMDALRRMLERKPLIVTGPVYESEVEALRSLEPAGGLCLQLQVVRDETAYE